MTTAAAIDRLVHHSIIIELNVPSFRLEEAEKRAKNEAALNHHRIAKEPRVIVGPAIFSTIGKMTFD